MRVSSHIVLFIFLMGYTRSHGELAVLCFIVGLGSGVYVPAIIPILTIGHRTASLGKGHLIPRDRRRSHESPDSALSCLLFRWIPRI